MPAKAPIHASRFKGLGWRETPSGGFLVIDSTGESPREIGRVHFSRMDVKAAIGVIGLSRGLPFENENDAGDGPGESLDDYLLYLQKLGLIGPKQRVEIERRVCMALSLIVAQAMNEIDDNQPAVLVGDGSSAGSPGK